MTIRKATMSDLPRMEEIYAYAREQMKKNGNPTQWGNSHPTKETLINYICNEQSYLIVENDDIFGTFVFFIGDDKTYHIIEDGAWLNEDEYGVIHCVASDGRKNGIVGLIVDYCGKCIANLRIDTHRDNHIMQHVLDKLGFVRCGIIYTRDGTKRIAFQRAVEE